MMVLEQGSGSAAPVSVPQGAGIEVMALIEQQVQSVRRLVQLEGDAVSIRRQLAAASGEEAKTLQHQLTITESIIDGEKAKIANIKARIAEAQANAQAVQVAEVPPPPPAPSVWVQDDRMFGLKKEEFTAIFVFILAFPVIAAISWRIWRRSTKHTAPAPLQDDRLARLEQAVEAVAIEVERIGESQRFQAKLMTEKPQARKESAPRVITPV